ncbi:MAG: hypothetical protein A4E45_00951 [Methanosaeta sp. PtaB.Bin039]|nr:MAG: hypothetical protein A4E45_00951 [Methanosaeta sp. PtaB.Bin039]OPY45053.1 MAG: hypothetical protein A4E47_01174 [Methanosaeta sp. PtaU1.Bin028]HOT06654.1 pro-sigmaK processing inhibitor BofA family protein [Methanotrichaceae archaeon]HQF16682.1 pro-sigmaK processing inhibitor BofA family protein [Methanotrichaceae archaeon]HQI91306.1 pro-sigmaK processing inhibitor BofA family protein [Methanotrichaceae archaeon]
MLEIGVLLMAVAVILGLLIIWRSVKTFAINALVGLIILYLANAAAGLGIGYSWVVILVCAFGGALGALLVIVLRLMGIYL